MSEQSETPLTMEEALMRRQGVEPETEETIPEPTLDETIQGGLREAELMEQLTDPLSEEGPMMAFTTGTNVIPTEATSGTKQESASIGGPPHPAETYTQESPEKEETGAYRLLDIRPLETETYKVAEFLAGQDFSVHYVERQLTLISTIPELLPPTTQWDIPAETDLARIVYEMVMTPGFVMRVWPIVRMLMGTSVGNVVWEVKVICTLALMEVIRMLGVIRG